MNVRTLALAAAALGAALLLAPSAAAQLGNLPKGPQKLPPKAPKTPKSPESKGGPLDPEKVRKKSELQETRQTDSTGPRVATVAAGAVIEGRSGADAVQRIRFEGIRGAEVDLRLEARESGVAAKGVLRGPDAEEVATFTAVKGKDGVYELDGFALPASGVFTVEVSLDKGAAGTFRLETAMDVPSRLDEEREWTGGRPHRILLGGMTDRALRDLTVRAKDRALGLDFTARLFDPDGFPVDLEPYLKRTSDEGLLVLRGLPLGVPGDYELFVADKARVTGEATITARFDNPPESKERVKL